MKYVILSMPNGFTTEEFPVLFPDVIDHCAMVPRGATALSAGFVDIMQNGDAISAFTHGRSISLNLNSATGDAWQIERLFRSRS